MTTRPFYFPQWFDRFLVRFVNPVSVQVAPYLPGWAQIIHTGRRSGKQFRTPVNAVALSSRLYVALGHATYTDGTYTDWVRNVLAAEGAQARILGKTRTMTSPLIITADSSTDSLPWIARTALKLGFAVFTADLH